MWPWEDQFSRLLQCHSSAFFTQVASRLRRLRVPSNPHFLAERGKEHGDQLGVFRAWTLLYHTGNQCYLLSKRANPMPPVDMVSIIKPRSKGGVHFSIIPDMLLCVSVTREWTCKLSLLTTFPGSQQRRCMMTALKLPSEQGKRRHTSATRPWPSLLHEKFEGFLLREGRSSDLIPHSALIVLEGPWLHLQGGSSMPVMSLSHIWSGVGSMIPTLPFQPHSCSQRMGDCRVVLNKIFFLSFCHYFYSSVLFSLEKQFSYKCFRLLIYLLLVSLLRSLWYPKFFCKS